MFFIRIATYLLPIRFWANMFDKWNATVVSQNEEEIRHIIRLKKAIKVVNRYALWKPNCLVNAITAKLYLQYVQIHSSIYLGVQLKGKDMYAHAWVTTENNQVVGNLIAKDFTEVYNL